MNTRPSTNISRPQKYLLDFLQNHPDLMVIKTDKRLGPAVIERDRYIRLILLDHLTKGNTYENISQAKVYDMMDTFKQEIKELVTFDHESDLDDEMQTYFKHGLSQQHRIPQFYGTTKVHKEFSDGLIPFRPVNSQRGSLSAIALNT